MATCTPGPKRSGFFSSASAASRNSLKSVRSLVSSPPVTILPIAACTSLPPIVMETSTGPYEVRRLRAALRRFDDLHAAVHRLQILIEQRVEERRFTASVGDRVPEDDVRL